MKVHFNKTRFNKTIILTAVLLLIAMVGCGGGGANIKPTAASDVVATIKTELEALGQTCEYSFENDYEEITCNSDDTYKTLIKYYKISKRISFMSFFELATPCDEIYHEVMTYNWEFNVAQASCQDDTIVFLAYTILPDSGINGYEIHNFLEWWASSLVTSLNASGLWDSIN